MVSAIGREDRNAIQPVGNRSNFQIITLYATLYSDQVLKEINLLAGKVNLVSVW